MSFYTTISPYYDDIFPADTEEVSFTAKRLTGRKSVLDIGCGTGNKTIHYARAGRKIIAVDNDPAMIAAARSFNSGPGVDYRVLSMLDLKRTFTPGGFDALLCLGNTLVHLFRPAVIQEMVADMSTLLEDDGLAVIQILNYDRILDKNIESLPLLETERVRFERSYARQGGVLRFVTKLTVKDTGEELNNDIPLYPLRRGELDDMLHTGFRRVEYGDFHGRPLTEDSLALIALAWK